MPLFILSLKNMKPFVYPVKASRPTVVELGRIDPNTPYMIYPGENRGEIRRMWVRALKRFKTILPGFQHADTSDVAEEEGAAPAPEAVEPPVKESKLSEHGTTFNDALKIIKAMKRPEPTDQIPLTEQEEDDDAGDAGDEAEDTGNDMIGLAGESFDTLSDMADEMELTTEERSTFVNELIRLLQTMQAS